jgi:hypothetical protein
MADTESRPREDESSGANTDTDESGVTNPRECHETVDPETRDDVLTEYKHRCQVCGRRGPKRGGLATLHVHHIDRNPDGMDEHDLENVTLLCRSCHSWFHQQSTPEDSPVELTEADQGVLLPQDIEILRHLAANGPARTGDVASGVPSDHSVAAVRERLWVLMGLDNLVEARDRQIVDKDVETGEWGLSEQIENSARGHIPDAPQLLLQRMEDEQVRQALDRGCDRQKVMGVLGVSRRTTFNKVKRANAYDFPLDAFSRGGRPTDSERSDRSPATTDTGEADGDEQQRLDAVPDQDPDSLGRTETWRATEAGPETRSSNESVEDTEQAVSENGADEELRVRLQHAIDALQEVEQGL